MANPKVEAQLGKKDLALRRTAEFLIILSHNTLDDSLCTMIRNYASYCTSVLPGYARFSSEELSAIENACKKAQGTPAEVKPE